MTEVTMYSTGTCPYCERASNLLQGKAIAVNKIRVDLSEQEFITMQARSGLRTVPQIFIGERHIGGYTELYQLAQTGELDKLMAAAS